MLFGFNEEQDGVLPKKIWVEDIFGNDKYILSEFRITAQSCSFGDLKGKGTVTPRRIIVGNQLFDYAEINSLRSSSPEYLTWSGLSSIESEIVGDDSNPYAIKSFKAGFSKKEPETIFSEKISLALRASGGFRQSGGPESSVTISHQVSLESSSDELMSFYDHMELHQKFRKLVCISAWRNIGFKHLLVRRDDDYEEFIDGSHSRPLYRDVISLEFDQWEIPEKAKNSFYFRYAEIGANGLSTWFKLFGKFAKPLNEIAYIAMSHSHMALESQVVDFGIALDELGRMISQSNSLRLPNSVRESIGQVIADCEENYGEFLLEKNPVARDIANSYNAIKHFKFERNGVSREESTEPSRLLEVMYACKLLSIFWIAKQLNCPYGRISRRLQDDGILMQATMRWRRASNA